MSMNLSTTKSALRVNRLRKLLEKIISGGNLSISIEKGAVLVMTSKMEDVTDALQDHLPDFEPEDLPMTIENSKVINSIEAEISELLMNSPEKVDLDDITKSPFDITGSEDSGADSEEMRKVTTLTTFEDLFIEMVNLPVLDPRFSDSIGKKSIHTYRALFMRQIGKSMISATAAKMVVNITMAMKSRPRILGFFKSAMGISFKATFSEGVSVEKFFLERTQEATSLEDVLMPTVKIPDSVPEIAVLIFIQSKGQMKMTASDIASEIVLQLWSSSIYWDNELQEMNKLETKRQWDNWGKTSGRKTNRNSKVLSFDEEIYANSAADKVLLRTREGKFNPSSEGYTMADLVKYVEVIMGISLEVRRIDANDSIESSSVKMIDT